VLQIKATVHP